MKTMDKKKIIEDLVVQLETRKDTYDSFFVADLKGEYLSTNGKGGNISEREYFQTLIKENKDYVISDPLISKSSGKPMFVLAYSIRDNNGKQIGVLGNNVNLEAITNISQDVKIGKKNKKKELLDLINSIYDFVLPEEKKKEIEFLKEKEKKAKKLKEAEEFRRRNSPTLEELKEDLQKAKDNAREVTENLRYLR
jgi:predicted transcriptional regulator YheO